MTWRDLLLAALHQPRDAQATHPLAVVLFLLDGLAALQALKRATTPLAGQGVEGELDQQETVEHLYTYLCEMYLPPPETRQETPANVLKAPFCLEIETFPSLLRLEKAGEKLTVTAEDAAAFQKALQSTCADCLEWINGYNDKDGLKLSQASSWDGRLDSATAAAEQPPQPIEEMLYAATSTLPECDLSLQATLAQSIADRRFSIATSTSATPPYRLQHRSPSYSTGSLRWMLASLLKHYLGDAFGQHNSTEHAGSVRYAKDDRDDSAIRAYFSRPARANPAPEGLKRTGSMNSTNTTNTLDPEVKAELQQAKRDDKLRWLFGENINSKSLNIAKSYASTTPRVLSPVSPFAPPSPKYSRLNRQTSREVLSRKEVLDGFQLGSTGHTPLSPPHRRAWSAGSENTFRTSGSPSSSHFSPARQAHRVLHRGGLGDSTITLSSSIDDMASVSAGSGGRDSFGRTDSIDTFDSRTALMGGRDASQPRTMRTSNNLPYNGPFQSNLVRIDDISPENSPPQPQWPETGLHRSLSASSTRSEPAFPVRFEDDEDEYGLPPTTNMLTPKEKQSLVRKSRKLKAVLGEGVEEHGLFRKPTLAIQPRNDAEIEEEEKTPMPVTAPTSPAVDGKLSHQHLFDDDTADSSGMSRASSAAFGKNGPGNYTDTFTSPDMALHSPEIGMKQRQDAGHHGLGLEAGDVPPSPMSPSTSDGGSPIVSMRRSSRTEEMDAKEVRRKKLMKVQAFLGERVPVSALSEQAAIPISPPKNDKRSKRATKMLSKASTTFNNKLAKARPGLNMNNKGSLSADDKDRDVKIPFGVMRPKRSKSRSGVGVKRVESEESGPGGDWQYVTVEPLAEGNKGNAQEVPDSPTTIEAVEPAIAAIRKARKLEKMFGALPPAQMYSARKPAQILASRKLVARDDGPRPNRSQSNASLRSQTSSSSLYRTSLASLRYIAESGDTALMDDLARVVLAEEDEPSDFDVARADQEGQFQIGDDEEDEESRSVQGDISSTDDELGELKGAAAEGLSRMGRSSTDTTASLPVNLGGRTSGYSMFSPFSQQHGHLYQQEGGRASGSGYRGRESAMSGMTAHSSADSAFDMASRRSQSQASSRSSLESVRIQFKRAHKLARVFGTTRGEVFNKVLDDIEADLDEEGEELDEEERKDILESVAALRASL